MAQSLKLNNGNIFTVCDIVWDRQYADYAAGSAFGLAVGEPVASWLDLSSYIDPDWEPEMTVDHPYGFVHNLNYVDTIANLQPYVDWVKANGAFIWGDILKGGMYICKRSATTYNIYMFCGSGILEADHNQMRYYIHDYATTQNLTLEQIRSVSIFHTIYQAGDANAYNVYMGGDYDENGVCVTYRIFAVPDYNNPLDPSQITSAPYTGATIPWVPISDTTTNNEQYVVNPIGLGTNFQTPVNMVIQAANADTYIKVSQEIGERGYSDDPDYIQKGSWWGGDGNKVSQDPNTGSSNNTGGGYGTPSQTSIPCGGTGEDQYDSDGTTAGFFAIYDMSDSDMAAFNAWLMDKSTSLDAAWVALWTALQRVYQQPIDLILGAAAIKHTLRQKTVSSEIKFCGIGTEIFVPTAYQYQTIDMGEIEVLEQYKSYLDYNGYSETSIYLPFIGIQALEQNDIMGSKIHLLYQIDNLTGACIAQVEVTRSQRTKLSKSDDTDINSYLYTFQGNCMQQLPITANDWQKAMESAINIATGAAGIAASAEAGNPAGVVGGAAGIAKDALNLKPSIKHGSSTTSCFGMMDCMQPYLILKRPIRAIPADLAKYKGYRCSKTAFIKDCKGFTQVYDAANLVDNIPCTDAEKKEIAQLLSSGIIV